MELFLNVLWLLIALAALGTWRYIWKRQECRHSHKPWQQWTAFACALIFVFFAVSLSDDLHAAAILADDCVRGRHHSLAWNCSCSSHGDEAPLSGSLSVAPAATFSNPLRPTDRITVLVSVSSATGDPIPIALRGPPSDSL